MKPARYNLRGFLRFTWRWLFHTPWSGRRALVAAAFYLVYPLYFLLVWSGLLLDRLFFPGFRRRQVVSPVFIAGNPRSGTTFLHRLLARDRRFTTMKMWEILFAPSVTGRTVVAGFAALDRWIGSYLHRSRRAIEEDWQEKNVMHEVSLAEPEEDDYLLLHIWSAMTTGLSSGLLEDARPYTFFDRALPRRRRDRIFEFYRRCLQRHLHWASRKRVPGRPEGRDGGGDRLYLAKNPALCPKVASVYECFPDAKIVYLVRSPLQMIPSYVSMMIFSWQVVGLPTEGEHGDALRAFLLEMAGHWYRHPLEVLDRAPEDQAAIVRYDELTRDPEATVRGVYRRFGLEVDGEFAQVLREATERAREYESRHEYSLEEVGLTREELVEEFRDVFDRFGFETG